MIGSALLLRGLFNNVLDVAKIGFKDLVKEDFVKIKDDVLQEVDEASEFEEQFEHDHDNSSMNKGILVRSRIDDFNLQQTS